MAFWTGQWWCKQRVGEALWDSDGHSRGEQEVRALGQVMLLTSCSDSCCWSLASLPDWTADPERLPCVNWGLTHKPWKNAALRHWLGGNLEARSRAPGWAVMLPGGRVDSYPGYGLETDPAQALEIFPRGLQVSELPGVETRHSGKGS